MEAPTDGSPGKFEVALARKATTIARLGKAGVENKGAISAMLGSIIPKVVMGHHKPRNPSDGKPNTLF